MDLTRSNSKRYKMYIDELDRNLQTSSTAVKIQEIRQQLESLLSSARNKKVKKSSLKKISINTVSPQYCGRSLSINDAKQAKKYDPLRIKTSPKTNKFKYPHGQLVKSVSISDSSSRIANVESFENDSEMIPVDTKLTAYKKFIDSLTRIVQDSYHTSPSPDSIAISVHSPKRSVEEKQTFVIEKNNYDLLNSYTNQNTQRAEKTTYCRPVNNEDDAIKAAERNAKLQLLVKKLVEAREKEKQAEAWNNYINELKNKHGYCEFVPTRTPRMFYREDEQPDITDVGHNCSRQPHRRPSLREILFNDLYGASSSIRPDNSFQRRSMCEPTTHNTYKYKNNSYCLPMSSQARLIAMKRGRCRHTSCRPIGKYYRGSAIIVEKDLSNDGKYRLESNEECGTSPQESELWECRSIQTGKHLYISKKSKECQISEKNSKIQRITSFADQLRNRLRSSRSNNNEDCLNNIEEKLDVLIQSFNGFMREMKAKKVLSDVKNAGVSCTSLNKYEDVQRVKSDTYSLFNKGRSIICERAQYHPRSAIGFPPCPRKHTIDEIMIEEKDKSDRVKRDIERILNTDGQCAVKIMIDIPTKEHSTEVTRSFYSTQEETIVEEAEPVEREEEKMLCNVPDNNNMTIAVNTDPLGLLALFRVSAESVKQILSYMPQLDYVSWLARRQLAQARPVASYVCNICGSAFSRPAQLSEHIHTHDLPTAKNCCVCRHVLDRLRARSGMFACAHCGQVFTRAYCRELHEQTCPLAGSRRKPSLMLLS